VLRASVSQREKEKAERATLVQQERLVKAKARAPAPPHGPSPCGAVHGQRALAAGALPMQGLLYSYRTDIIEKEASFGHVSGTGPPAVRPARRRAGGRAAWQPAQSPCLLWARHAWRPRLRAACRSARGGVTRGAGRTQGRMYTLPDVWIRPPFGGKGRKMTGQLEAHANGFRYTSPKGEQLDIMYRRVRLLHTCRVLIRAPGVDTCAYS